MRRLPSIDVHRGVIVVLMVMHHTVDAWIRDDQRHGELYLWLRHLGGLPAPGFLFLAGLSSALVLARERSAGTAPRARVVAGVRRGLYVLGIAFAFRVVGFVFGGNPLSNWPMVFRVDILNCMGVALALTSALCAPARTGRASATVATLLGLAFLLPAPLVWGQTVAFPSELVGNYVAGNGMLVMFPLFPWLSFAAFGFALGEGLAAAGARGLDEPGLRRLARWMAVGGALLCLGGWALDKVPFAAYPPHDYWKCSPLFMAIRLGLQLLLLWALTELATRSPAWLRARDPLQLLGRHSLAIYLVHLELVYGQLSRPVRGQLSLFQALAGMALVNLACYGLARGLEGWDRRARHPVPPPLPAPASPPA